MSDKETSDLDEKINMAAETLAGDLRDVILNHVRTMETPWSKLSEEAQGDRIYAATNAAEHIIRKACALIAKRGFDHVPVVIKDFTVKEKAIKGKFEAYLSESAMVLLGDHQGQSAIIVLSDAEGFLGEQGQAKPDADAPELPLAGDMPEHPDMDEAA